LICPRRMFRITWAKYIGSEMLERDTRTELQASLDSNTLEQFPGMQGLKWHTSRLRK
jgi:hypothetical protein